MMLAPSRTARLRLPPDQAHIWSVDLDGESESYGTLRMFLDRDERIRSERFRFERDRVRFVISHGALREILAYYLGTRPGRIRYVDNGHGKPELSPEPEGGIRFNLSHSDGLALVAVVPDASVGVDVERVRPLGDELDIAQNYFSAAEVNRLAGLRAPLRAREFFSYWTRWEALSKASGEGLARSGSSSHHAGLADHAGSADNADPDRPWSLFEIRVAPGYAAAVAIEGKGWSLIQREWRSGAKNPLMWPAGSFPAAIRALQSSAASRP